MRRRVVVTGIGAVTPVGLSARESWKNVLEGQSGVGTITRFNASECSVQIAAEIKNFDVSAVCNPKEARKMGRFTQLALVAGMEAYRDSGLETARDKIPSERIGVNIGVGMGGLPEIEEVHNEYLAKGFRRITPFFITQTIANLAAGQLSLLLGLKGPNFGIVSACASSAHSIGESFRQIQRGDTDVVFAGGSEAVIGTLGIGGFAAMRALSTRNAEPERASRPFDKDRDGFVMGEGAGVLILEEYESARSRGAKIYAEILGYGASSDAHHITSVAPEGEGGGRAMALALKESGLAPEQIDYINAHGTSTPAGDVEEARAIAKVFQTTKAGRDKLHVSSTKSMTGHMLGAAGAVESIFTILAIHEKKIPPTLNLDSLDPGCAELGIDFTPHKAVDKPVRYALSNSFGFGGTNASLLYGQID